MTWECRTEATKQGGAGEDVITQRKEWVGWPSHYQHRKGNKGRMQCAQWQGCAARKQGRQGDCQQPEQP